ncbi:hypothetical protein QVD99_006730 [Batrachochytrium dendrobatidis]|nr:hypothetical protein O5D80_005290 [Batrachochytrium dendrobatidis]KAK5666667.1 hypothetical protein QVD99_006730 [Batrachochytrium dendrobatidis]
MSSDYHPEFLITLMFISVSAIIANTLMAIAVMRNQAIRTAEYFYNVNVVLSDLVFAVMVLLVTIISLANGIPAVTNYIGCQAVGYVLQSMGASSVLTIALITLNHYRVIVLEKPRLTYHDVAVHLGGLWLICLTTSIIQFVFGEKFIPRPAHLHCHYDYASKDLLIRILTGQLIVHLVGLPIVVCLAYWAIYRKVAEVEQLAVKGKSHYVTTEVASELQSKDHKQTIELAPMQNSYTISRDVKGSNRIAESNDGTATFKLAIPDTNSENFPTASAASTSASTPIRPHIPSSPVGLNEALSNVAKRGLMISMSFSICWLPTLVVCILEISTGQTIHWRVDAWVTLIAAFNTLSNPIVFFYVDRRLWKSLQEMVKPLHNYHL